MMIKKYRKKPVVIEAVEWHGDNLGEIKALSSSRDVDVSVENQLLINTLEGQMRADLGDMIIKGVSGEIYPCKPDIFDKTYEEVI